MDTFHGVTIDPNLTLSENVSAALSSFRNKFDRDPQVCLINPDLKKLAETEEFIFPEELDLRAERGISCILVK